MLFFAKQSKLEKMEVKYALFKTIVVSHEVTQPEDDEQKDIVVLPQLAPPAELVSKCTDSEGKINTKKLVKGYIQYLESEIGRSVLLNLYELIDRKIKGIILVCSDNEWEQGYLKALVSHIEEKIGVTFTKATGEYFEELNKKLKKISKKSEGLSKKEIKKKIAKIISSEVEETSQMTVEGLDYLAKERRAFAIDKLMIALISSGAVAIVEGDNEDQDGYVLGKKEVLKELKKSSVRKSILAYIETGKKARKIVDRVAEASKIKVNESKLDKMDAAQLVTLTLDIYSEILNKRFKETEQEVEEQPKKDKKKKDKKHAKQLTSDKIFMGKRKK